MGGVGGEHKNDLGETAFSLRMTSERIREGFHELDFELKLELVRVVEL